MDVRYDDLPGETCCVEPIGLRSLALDTWLVSAARILSIAEENGRDIISLCNGCYMSLKEAEHALKDEATRENVNTVLRSIGREYGGNVSVRHIASFIREQGEDKVRSFVTTPMSKLKLAAHPGCHMVRPSRILGVDHHFRPALLTELASWTGAEVVSTEAWPKCCGGGLSGIDDALSTKMLGSVVEGLKRTGATQILDPLPILLRSVRP